MAEPPAPNRVMKKTSLNIPKHLHHQLKMLAVEQERDMGELVTEALDAYLRHAKARTKGR